MYMMADALDEPHLLIRSAVLTADGTRAVVADFPVNIDLVVQLDDRMATRMEDLAPTETCDERVARASASATLGGLRALFRQSVVIMDCTDWATGRRGVIYVRLNAPVSKL